MSTAPRKVSFEASEDGGESSSVCSLPRVELSPRRCPLSPSSPLRCKREKALLRRPTPSICLSSLVMTPAPSPVNSGQESSPLSTVSDDSNFAWGQFVDVVPPSCTEEIKTDTGASHGGTMEVSRNAYQPYTLNKPPVRHPLKRNKKRKGFLPDFILTIPSELSKEEESLKGSLKNSASHECPTGDVVMAMKRMRF